MRTRCEWYTQTNDPQEAGHLSYIRLSEPVGSTEQEVNTLRAVAVIDIILAVEPVVELEEEREVGLGLRAENHAI